MKICLTNKSIIGGLWIDARISDGSKPFIDLPTVNGFPRKIEYLEKQEVELSKNQFVLYRMEADVVSPEDKVRFSAQIFKVPVDNLFDEQHDLGRY